MALNKIDRCRGEAQIDPLRSGCSERRA